MKCEYCKKNHEGIYGSGRFCSSKCAKGFSSKEKRKEINEKVKNKLSKNFCKKCGKKVHQRNKDHTQLCRKCLYSDLGYKEKISKSTKGKCGGFRKNSGRGKQSWYESYFAGKVYLQSSWELKYAKYLDENNINWSRPTKGFKYLEEKKERHYIPDFYLIEQDLYIEIKGYKTKLDDLKWSSLNNLKILYENDLKELKIL
jgi:hypothetical protein